MQKINYKEKILLEETINELLLINIDDELSQTKECDYLKVSGKIKISGEVNTNDGKRNFNHPIDVDILLSNEQLEDKEVKVSIEDFNYSIDDKTINIDLIMKIDGLKEIDAYFPPQEDQEDIQIEKVEEEIIEEITQPTIELQEERNDLPLQETDNDEGINIKEEKYSLLNQVFRNKSLKKETSYFFHVVKNQSTYQDIATQYNIDIDELKNANNNEDIYIGKLIYIPKSE